MTTTKSKAKSIVLKEGVKLGALRSLVLSDAFYDTDTCSFEVKDGRLSIIVKE